MAAYTDSQGQEAQAFRLIVEGEPETVKFPWVVLSGLDGPRRYSDDEFHQKYTQRFPRAAGAEPETVGPKRAA